MLKMIAFLTAAASGLWRAVRALVAGFWRALRSGSRWLLAQFDMADVFLFNGLGLLAYGLTLVWLPAAFIVPGAVLVFIALRRAPGAGAE